MVVPEGVAGPPKLNVGPPLDPGAVGLTEPFALAAADAGLLKLKPEKTDAAGAAAAANGLLDTAVPGVTAAEAVAAAANGLLTVGAAGAAPKTNAGLAADVSTDEAAGLKLKDVAGTAAAG